MKWLKTLCLSISMISALSLTAQSGNYSYSQQTDMSTSQINWLTSYDQAIAQSKASSKPVLILFTGTTWCPACMKLERDVLNRPEFLQAVASRFVFLKAEFPDYSQGGTNASPFKPLLDRYNINSFPTMLVINANGQPLYTVPYQSGGAQAYIQQFMRQSNQGQMQTNRAPSY
jgi:thiol:disulfide interchange protein